MKNMSASDLLKPCIWAPIINCILSILTVKSFFLHGSVFYHASKIRVCSITTILCKHQFLHLKVGLKLIKQRI